MMSTFMTLPKEKACSPVEIAAGSRRVSPCFIIFTLFASLAAIGELNGSELTVDFLCISAFLLFVGAAFDIIAAIRDAAVAQVMIAARIAGKPEAATEPVTLP